MTLNINNVGFSYQHIKTLEGVSFCAETGQNITLLGESGSGKSTLLKLIYGLYDLEEGEILLDNIPVLGPKFNLVPGHDDMKYLAQDFDLMPFITVAENVGKYLSNIYPEKKKERVRQLLEMVEMLDFADTKAQFLSGGQQQRVALAKALALEPKILLLDEPFSQIDASRRNALRRNLFQYLKKQNITCIIATHDSVDALSFSDFTVVLKNGKMIDSGIPTDLYQNPKSWEIASLFGECNILPGSWFGDSENHILRYPHQLRYSENSGFEVLVKSNYYKGSHYLIKAVKDGIVLFFEHKEALMVDEIALVEDTKNRRS